MSHTIDPRVERFLRIHAVSEREAVEADVADHRDETPAERWRMLEALTPLIDWLQCRSPEHRARVLEHRDPPHPSYRGIIERLRSQ